MTVKDIAAGTVHRDVRLPREVDEELARRAFEDEVSTGVLICRILSKAVGASDDDICDGEPPERPAAPPEIAERLRRDPARGLLNAVISTLGIRPPLGCDEVVIDFEIWPQTTAFNSTPTRCCALPNMNQDVRGLPEDVAAEVERRIRLYQEQRRRLNLPPIVDDEARRQEVLSCIMQEQADAARRQQQGQQQEQQRELRQADWRRRILATHQDMTIVAKEDEVYCIAADGQEHALPAPPFTAPLNRLNADCSLNALNTPTVVDDRGYAWTRLPQSAAFAADGNRLTIVWIAEAHESRYGWEYSHQVVQPTTWQRDAADGNPLWRRLEAV